MRVSSRHHQAQKRRFQILIFNVICADMAFNMMDADQRKPCGKADGLCCGNSYQKRPHQPRAIGNGNGRQIRKLHSRIFQCLFYYLIDLFNMLPGCNFRHHTAVLRMQCDLGIDHIRKNFPSILHHRSCCFITGAFNGQYDHIILHSLFSLPCCRLPAATHKFSSVPHHPCGEEKPRPSFPVLCFCAG